MQYTGLAGEFDIAMWWSVMVLAPGRSRLCNLWVSTCISQTAEYEHGVDVVALVAVVFLLTVLPRFAHKHYPNIFARTDF
jgi:hypothetical protein